VERQENELMCSGMKKMLIDGVDARWRERRGGERCRRDDIVERSRGAAAR
jgi:hypothetical protein